MTIRANLLRDVGIFKLHMAGLTLRAIGEQHGVTKERIRVIVATMGRRCRDYVVINKLPKPDYFPDYEYQNNKEYWLSILELYQLQESKSS